MTRSVDRVSIEIDNDAALIGQNLNAEARTGAVLLSTLYRIYENLEGTQKWRVERMFGVLIIPKSSDSAVRCEMLADTYATGAIVGNYEVQRECTWRYKDPDTCGYVGALPTCSLKFNGANGCVEHFGTEDEAKSHYGGHGLFIDEQTRNQIIENSGGLITDRMIDRRYGETLRDYMDRVNSWAEIQ
jgi:hypothetical protein